MAGHSQFKNIMHRKGAQDAKRARQFAKLIREITVSARTGLPDPAANPRLRSAMAEARAVNMPRDTIERAVKKASGAAGGEDYVETRYEGYGPAGVAVIVEALTDNRNRTAADVRAAFNKHGGAMGEANSVSFQFTRLGAISYPASAATPDAMLGSTPCCRTGISCRCCACARASAEVSRIRYRQPADRLRTTTACIEGWSTSLVPTPHPSPALLRMRMHMRLRPTTRRHRPVPRARSTSAIRRHGTCRHRRHTSRLRLARTAACRPRRPPRWRGRSRYSSIGPAPAAAAGYLNEADAQALADGTGNALSALSRAVSAEGGSSSQRAALEILAAVMDEVFDSPYLPDVMKSVFGRMQIPILKAALADPNVFAKPRHRVRQFFDMLSAASVGLRPDDPHDKSFVALAYRLAEVVRDDSVLQVQAFAKAADDLDAFLDTERAAYNQKLAQAQPPLVALDDYAATRAKVHILIGMRLAGKAMPPELRGFFDDDGLDRLTAAYMQDGPEGVTWKAALADLDDLLWSIAPPPDPRRASDWWR